MMYLMKHTKIVALCAIALLGVAASSCSAPAQTKDEAAPGSSSWFRAEPRPTYEKTIRAADLEPFIARGGTVLDVRLEEDYASDPVIIPGAERRDPDKLAEWANRIPKNQPVAVYCVKGKWVSQKAAAYLADQGLDAYSVEGGLEAWKVHMANR